MKRISMILIALSIILTGCTTDPDATGILAVSVKASNRGMDVLNINTDHYMVEVLNTDRNISYGSVRVDSQTGSLAMTVASGNTTVTVRAYDAEGTEIGNGQSSVNVRPREENHVMVTVEEIVGTGSIDIAVTTAISNVKFIAEIYRSLDRSPYRTVALAGNDGILRGSVSLENGFYAIRIKDADGNIYGPLKPFRIVAGKSVGYTAVIEDRFNVQIGIENGIIHTPSITITGGKAEYRDGDSYSLKAEALYIENPTFQWFLDGRIMENCSSATISGTVVPGSLKPGRHTVSVLAGNGSVLWTESFEFKYIPSATGITVDPEEMHVGSSAAEKSFRVMRNTAESTYVISALPSWITIKSSASAGLVDTVTLAISMNDSQEERRAAIMVGDRTLTVIQDGGTTPTVPERTEIEAVAPHSIAIENFEGGSAEFTVERRNGKAFDYIVDTSDSWLRIERISTSGLVDTWRVTADRNAGSSSRKGNVQVGEFNVAVVQLSAFTDVARPVEIVIDSVYPALNGGNIAYKDMNYQINAHVLPSTAPQKLNYRIVSMGSREKSYGTYDWRIKDRDVEAYVEYDQNGRFSSSFDFWLAGTDNVRWSRNFKMVITTEDGSISREIPFTMDRDTSARIESVHPTTISIDNPAGDVSTIQVTTSTDGSTIVSIVKAPEWVRVKEESISGKTREFSAEFAPHRGTLDRTGEIVFADQNGNQASVTISQKANPETSSPFVWLSGISVDESRIKPQPGMGEFFEYYETAGVYDGWYNVSKAEMAGDTSVEDGLLCWAMSASGSIHWWAENNKAYIDAFRRLHPEVNAPQPLGGQFFIPAMDFTYRNDVEQVRDKSSIAKIYIGNHLNKGDDPNQALVDMLFTPRIPRDGNHRANAVYPGWFEEVFKGRVDEVVWDTPILSMTDLHFSIEDSIRRNTAVILTYTIKLTGNDHAVNLWGVKYDEYGNISQVIVADNNSVGDHRIKGESFLTNYVVKEGDLGYADIGNPADPGKKDYMGTIRILTDLDLGTEIWDEWAANNNVII